MDRVFAYPVKLPDTINNREALAMMSPEDRQTFEEAIDQDDFFVKRRLRLRREDAEALANGTATPEELQRKNSIFPPEFFKDIKIDYARIANGPPYVLPGRLRRPFGKGTAARRRAGR